MLIALRRGRAIRGAPGAHTRVRPVVPGPHEVVKEKESSAGCGKRPPARLEAATEIADHTCVGYRSDLLTTPGARQERAFWDGRPAVYMMT
jgi:hypothetical protein